MTFSKPYPGTFAYEGTIPSQTMNYINDHFTSILDKTGDTITGTIHMGSSASLVFDVGAGALIFNGGSVAFNNSTGINFNGNNTIVVDGTSNLIISPTAFLLNGGTLNIVSGGTLGINSGGTMHIKSGGNGFVDSGGTLTVSNGGILALAGGSNVNAASGANLNMNAGSFQTNTNQTTNFTGASQIVEISAGALFILPNSAGSFLTVGTGNTINVHGTFKTDVWPVWNSPITRQVIESTTSGISTGGTWAGGLQFVYDTGVGGSWSMQLQRSHNKATLVQLFVGFSVGGSHAAVPANRPSLSLVRYRWDGMFSPSFLSNVDPQVFPNPGSGAAYYDSGNQQFMNYVCNQNNVIDNENYIYVLSITDESGANSVANNAFGLVTLEYQVIPDLSWNI